MLVELGECQPFSHAFDFQLIFIVFPSFQCPDSFLKFLQAVRESKSLDENVGPPVVHCSAGIGRSGTFCLVDSCIQIMHKR